ncbi:NHLP family bacteriocin export ABC transporter peptidase/permease/ATPase subunit [Methyloraptor flagellatus]|uniref:NHLP family bacteriocin export ABC transporter peptidase/permease/ATPase subunit n=1 Tax=Methyloraptor flagellatus TaxID=3162530 RepID=A0AAU7X7E0_9HYPH
MSGRLASIRRRATPTVLQHEVSECGAACLAMILGYHRRWISLEHIRAVAGVSRDGAKASSIVKAARHFGLESKGLSCEPDALSTLPMPAIVFWNFNHYVVLEGRRGDRVWINDPATGPRVVTVNEFEQAFTGVVLTFVPGADFKAGGKRPGFFTGLADRLRSFRAALFATLIVGFLLLVPGLAIPGLQRAFTDYYLIAGLHDWLWWLIAGLVGAAALRMLLTWLQRSILSRLNVRMGLQSNGRLLWHLLHLPIGFFSQRSVAELANRSGLGDRLNSLMANALIMAVVNLLAISIYGLVMAGYDYALTGVAVAFAVLNLWLLAVMTKRMSDAHRRMLQEEGQLQALLFQGFSSLESFRASGTEDLFFRRWAGAHAKVLTAEQRMTRSRRLLTGLAAMLTSITGIAIVLIGGIRVMDGLVTVGVLAAFQTLAANFNGPVASFVGLSAQLQDSHGYVERLDDVLLQPVDPMFDAERGSQTPESIRGAVEVEALTFSHAEIIAPLFRDLSLSVKPGHRIGIVGSSGSGKSTFGRLVVGLAKARQGDVRIDGVSTRVLDPGLLRSMVAYVEQQVVLFPGTVRDNITVWDPVSTDEMVVRAAKDAMIHSVIAARPNAYDSVVEEDGRNFSGGECQRMAIARALATDPAVVVLDEATSALDALVERDIVDNIRRRGCTCIIISHRLSAIRDCDEIVVLDNGGIVERGRHADLIARGGHYARLVKA